MSKHTKNMINMKDFKEMHLKDTKDIFNIPVEDTDQKLMIIYIHLLCQYPQSSIHLNI